MPEKASERALYLDSKLENQAAEIKLPRFKEVLAHLRVYLSKQNLELGLENNIQQILKTVVKPNLGIITVGPPFDKGPTESHFKMPFGARLSFGITLREGNGACSLIAYRFHIQMGGGSKPAFYRFDLNERRHDTPLVEPRCHVHPGRDDIRLPFPVLGPIEVLDRIFYVIAAR